MKKITDIQTFVPEACSVVTIGTFDGVHVGHRKIIDRIVTAAKTHQYRSTIFTFFPHPRMVLQQDNSLKLINTLEEKIQILESYGIDQLVIHPFDKAFSRLTAEEFVSEMLVEKLHAKKIIIGYDHRFGRNRTATIDDLIDFGKQYHFDVEQIPAKEIDEVSVSSTKIRQALLQGDITTANVYLGYEFMLTGTVVKGKGLGRQLDFPTANIHIQENYKLIPKIGVYIVHAILYEKQVYGLMNIGFNPTVNGTEKTIEVYFLDFDADLYNQKIQVRIIDRIRDEEKFDSIETLKSHMQKDLSRSLPIIAKHQISKNK
ncbi:bifunctional riboflavin kinase/FAD synthetase [Imtechella halotolerans]|uniref:Riboflavin biosynthesis protein n=1 Tax=Imtechella halotolerans K1 TaxID=946077 RepID=I0WHR8_9FLAO|nr:bifunctional riboflavin kinase/FAD synthetase [Imtechella halotolerans]EID75934.1 riboflavin biosynthesis protein ribf [Imtechella halotolerans K1]WMQ63124.1 bifunctional riboflavin kinase/FAD synthetase [Imtechella halotolerans]